MGMTNYKPASKIVQQNFYYEEIMHSSIKIEVIYISFSIMIILIGSLQIKTYFHDLRKDLHIINARIYILPKYSLKSISQKFSKRADMKFGEYINIQQQLALSLSFRCNGATFACI